MDQQAIDAFTPPVRDRVFAARDLKAQQLVDLGGFESFVFACESRNSILRVTHTSHRDADQLLAELEWIADLHHHGAAVCRPLPGPSGELVTPVDEFHVCEFERARGRLITETDWTPSLFDAWGQCIGRFHRLAQDYVPDHRRIDWFNDENFSIEGRIPVEEEQVRGQMEEALSCLRTRPVTASNYGLIHCDAHAGNFFLADTGELTFFDFDDACYCWYGYDVATILFGAVLQPWIEPTRSAQERAAREFLPPFLEGYARENPVGSLLLPQMPLFLKIRELSLYGVVHAFLGGGDPDNWYATKFMTDRRRRIEAGEPYLDIPFD